MQPTRRWKLATPLGSPARQGLIMIGCGLVLSQGLLGADLGTAFTYQGQLNLSGTPANGDFDFCFTLWNEPEAGLQIGPTLTFDGKGNNPPSIVVSNGLLTVQLDFDSGAFDGDARWLEVGVKSGDSDSFVTLTPRLALSPAPYSLFASQQGGSGGGWVDDGTVVRLDTATDLVGIGITTNLSSKLTVAGAIRNAVPGSTTILVRSTNETGIPDADGFRLRNEDDYFGSSRSATIFELTDGNTSDPDGGFVFLNTGNDGIPEQVLVIEGNGDIGIGRIPNDSIAKVEVQGLVYAIEERATNIAVAMSGVAVSTNPIGTSLVAAGILGTALTESTDSSAEIWGVSGLVQVPTPVEAIECVFMASTPSPGLPIGVVGLGGFPGWAGYFIGDVFISGDQVGGDSKVAVEFSSGETRLLHSYSSPEAWVEDFGEAQLINGQVNVSLEPLFAETVNTDITYHVFVTPSGECNGLFVTNKTSIAFDVKELQGGSSNLPFSYRVVAKRKGNEDCRLEELRDAHPGDISAGIDALLDGLPQ